VPCELRERRPFEPHVANFGSAGLSGLPRSREKSAADIIFHAGDRYGCTFSDPSRGFDRFHPAGRVSLTRLIGFTRSTTLVPYRISFSATYQRQSGFREITNVSVGNNTIALVQGSNYLR
jgi:hypothetical protein